MLGTYLGYIRRFVMAQLDKKGDYAISLLNEGNGITIHIDRGVHGDGSLFLPYVLRSQEDRDAVNNAVEAGIEDIRQRRLAELAAIEEVNLYFKDDEKTKRNKP